MKTLISATVVSSLLIAVCVAYPTSDSEATAQWHLAAPAFGCVEAAYSVSGQSFRVYACDHQSGSCVFPNNVPPCPLTAAVFGAKEVWERIINIRGREHALRFYNSGYGSHCYFTVLPQCRSGCITNTKIQEDSEECKKVILPGSNEVIYDPLDCAPETMGLNETKETSQNNIMEALLNLLMKN